MNVTQAIRDLRDDVVENGFDADIMSEIAKDNGCAPQLLERKFTEQYGVHPSEYQAPKKMSEEVEIQAALKVAREWNEKEFTRQGDVPCGVVFERNETQGKYVTVGWLGNRLACVRVADREPYYLKFRNTQAAVQFLKKRHLV